MSFHLLSWEKVAVQTLHLNGVFSPPTDSERYAGKLKKEMVLFVNRQRVTADYDIWLTQPNTQIFQLNWEFHGIEFDHVNIS